MKLKIFGSILMALSVASIAIASILDSMPPCQTFLYCTWIACWAAACGCDFARKGAATWELRFRHALEMGLCSVWGIYVFGGPLWVQTIAAVITALAAMGYIYVLVTEFLISHLTPAHRVYSARPAKKRKSH